MNYVKLFNINGVDTKQVACIELQGAPNAATEGAVGVLGMDVTSPTHEVYRCVAVEGSVYKWELLSAGMSIISATITGQGGESKTFPYDKLRIPKNYLIKPGDLILDKEGYLYQIASLGADGCNSTYCGTHIGGMASGDKDYTLSLRDGKLRLVTESGNVVSKVDQVMVDGNTLCRDESDGTTVVRAVKTINDTSLRIFVGEREEYESLSEEQKNSLFAIFTDDNSRQDIINEITDKLEDGRIKVGKARGDMYGNDFTDTYLRINANSEAYGEGDPVSGVEIHAHHAKPSYYHIRWETDQTSIDFGVIRWDGEKTVYSPVSILRSISGGLQHFAVKIRFDYDMGIYKIGIASIVMFNNSTGVETECTVENSTLYVQNLTDVPMSE